MSRSRTGFASYPSSLRLENGSRFAMRISGGPYSNVDTEEIVT
jgi:hypothetical protein